MNRKHIIILLIIFFFLQMSAKKTFAEYSPTTTQKFLIVGGILGGIELIHTALNLFSKKKKKNLTTTTTTNNYENYTDASINKEEELKKLLAPSKLLTLIEKTNTVISTNKNIVVSVQTNTISNTTNTNNLLGSTFTNYEIKTNTLIERYKITPQNMETNFTYKVTNTLTKKTFEYTAGSIDYYDVGVAYYFVNKKHKAKEYLLHTIAINKKKDEAIKFLMQHYKITLKEIRIEAKKYKTLKK